MPRQPAFDSKHPLWEELIKLRQSGTPIFRLVTLAGERGFPLSYRQINRGLQAVKYVKHLPDRSSHWLQRKVADMGAKIDALDTMHGLAALSAEKLFDIQSQLGDPELTIMRRGMLEKLEASERRTLWGFCHDIVEIEVELGLREKVKPQESAATGIQPGTLQEAIRDLEVSLARRFSGGTVTIREVELTAAPDTKETVAELPQLISPQYQLSEMGFTRAPGEEIIVNGEVLEEPPDEQEVV